MFGRVLDLICPPLCPLCGSMTRRNGADEAGLGRSHRFFFCPLPPCEACSERLATPDGAFCLRCGGRRSLSVGNGAENKVGNEVGSAASGCGHCRTDFFRFDRVIALGEYEKELRHYILRMKTDRTGRLADTLGGLLIRRRAEALRELRPNWVVPVPNHWKRHFFRGVNPPDRLAEHVSRFLGVPCEKRLVRRLRETELQHLLSKRGRLMNVEGAFALRSNPRLNPLSNRVFGGRILLVDDILTTGATCNEMTRLLRKAGAESVSVCVLARAEGLVPRPADRWELLTVE